jgi:hypothetical protein
MTGIVLGSKALINGGSRADRGTNSGRSGELLCAHGLPLLRKPANEQDLDVLIAAIYVLTRFSRAEYKDYFRAGDNHQRALEVFAGASR